MTLLTSLFETSRRRRMYRDLLQLDDYLLRDIGFNRHALREELAMHHLPQVRTDL